MRNLKRSGKSIWLITPGHDNSDTFQRKGPSRDDLGIKKGEEISENGEKIGEILGGVNGHYLCLVQKN